MLITQRGFPGGSVNKESACNAGDPGSIPGSGISPGKGMATHSSILAWRIPWAKEPGGLPSWGHTESDVNERLTLLCKEVLSVKESGSLSCGVCVLFDCKTMPSLFI